MPAIGIFAQLLAGNAIGLLGKVTNTAVEFHVGDIELGLIVGDQKVKVVHQPSGFIIEKCAGTLVEVLQIGGARGHILVKATLDTPSVGPVSRGGVIGTKKVISGGNPLVKVFLDRPREK